MKPKKLTEQEKIVEELIKKTERELSQAQKPRNQTREWSSSRGYRFLVQWSNAVLLRILIRKFTVTLPLQSFNPPAGGPLNSSDIVQRSKDFPINSSKIPLNSYKHFENRLKTQLDDACRSIISNLEEGYKRPTTEEYLKFIGYSEASLEEIHGLINQSQQDGFLISKKGSSLAGLGIDLKAWNEWCKNPLNSSKLLYFPLKESKGSYRNLKEIKGTDLTYEIFIELINKTDFLLRKLVESLEHKHERAKLAVAGYNPK